MRIAHLPADPAQLAEARRSGGMVRSLCGMANRPPLDLRTVEYRACRLCLQMAPEVAEMLPMGNIPDRQVSR